MKLQTTNTLKHFKNTFDIKSKLIASLLGYKKNYVDQIIFHGDVKPKTLTILCDQYIDHLKKSIEQVKLFKSKLKSGDKKDAK